MRIRLRQKYTNDELKEVYPEPHRHGSWIDHRQRVQSTVALTRWYTPVVSVADLSCGDAYIIKNTDAKEKYLGDYAPGYDYTGPIEETIKQIPSIDLFILSETIEHIDDPDTLLKQIREKTSKLILTTPKNEKTNENPQHYWGWGKEDMHDMLVQAGFTPEVYQELEFANPDLIYTYQMWGCS
jgi:hypothetical protein